MANIAIKVHVSAATAARLGVTSYGDLEVYPTPEEWAAASPEIRTWLVDRTWALPLTVVPSWAAVLAEAETAVARQRESKAAEEKAVDAFVALCDELAQRPLVGEDFKPVELPETSYCTYETRSAWERLEGKLKADWVAADGRLPGADEGGLVRSDDGRWIPGPECDRVRWAAGRYKLEVPRATELTAEADRRNAIEAERREAEARKVVREALVEAGATANQLARYDAGRLPDEERDALFADKAFAAYSGFAPYRPIDDGELQHAESCHVSGRVRIQSQEYDGDLDAEEWESWHAIKELATALGHNAELRIHRARCGACGEELYRLSASVQTVVGGIRVQRRFAVG